MANNTLNMFVLPPLNFQIRKIFVETISILMESNSETTRNGHYNRNSCLDNCLKRTIKIKRKEPKDTLIEFQLEVIMFCVQF